MKPAWKAYDGATGFQRPYSLPADERLAKYVYMGPSHVMKRKLGEEITQFIEYAAGDRVHDMLYMGATGTLVGFRYTYDKDGRLTEKDKQHQSTDDESYTYDTIGRLTAFDRPDGALADVEDQSWTLDDANNWASTTKDTGSGTPATETRTHTNTNTNEIA